MYKTLLICCLTSILFTTEITAQKDTSFPTPPKRKFVSMLGGDGIYMRDSIWKVGGYLGTNISQTALYQWSGGGSNSFAFLFSGNAFANYKKGKAEWDNNLDMKYGLMANGQIRNEGLAERNFQKNIDLLEFATNVGYELDSKKLYISFKGDFLSQFSRSYDYSQTDTSHGRFRKMTISKFGAPAVLTIGPGLTWKPTDYFTLFFSPIEGKMTFVTPDDPGRDTAHAADGTYTDRYYTDVDETRFGLQRGTSFAGELGGELDILFSKELVKNVSWKSHLNVFFSYTNNNYNTIMPYFNSALDSMMTKTISKSTSHIPTVKWDNDIVFKVNKILSATLSTRFIYQYNVQVPIDQRNNRTGAKGPDGITDVDKNGNPVLGYNKLQIFEQFGLGIVMKF